MELYQDTFEGFAEPAPQLQDVAHVLVDTDLPHLDRPLDYVIPDSMLQEAVPGRIVRVRLAGRRKTGWILSRSTQTTTSSLRSLESVISSTQVLTPAFVEVARRIAQRHVATLSQVFSLAIPSRVAGVEKQLLQLDESTSSYSKETSAAVPHNQHDHHDTSDAQAADESASDEADSTDSLRVVSADYPAGAALVDRLRRGDSPRAVVTVLPTSRQHLLREALRACIESGRSAIVVVPTATQCEEFKRFLTGHLAADIRLTGSEMSDALRYRTFLDGIAGSLEVLVGTRSAVWTPMKNLGLIVIWDDGDDSLTELRSPQCDAVDVAMNRAYIENCALIVAGFTRSVKAQALVHSAWAMSVVPTAQARRAAAPVIRIHGEDAASRDGIAGTTRIPAAALRVIRQGLEDGPVLIQVGARGYIPVVSCSRCHAVARCTSCNGPLAVSESGAMTCGWCDREALRWRCPKCSGTHLRSVRVGSARTAQEIARAIGGVSVLESSASHRITRPISRKNVVVVATAGAEPPADGGYAAGVILDARSIASRPELWAPQEAMRRWLNAFALLAPRASALLVGQIEQAMGQDLIRWDPVDYAQRLLDEREALGFFPAKTIISLDGAASDVRQIVGQVDAEFLGTVEHRPAGEGQEVTVRTLIRVANEDAGRLTGQLADIQRTRASRKLKVVKISVNPPELF